MEGTDEFCSYGSREGMHEDKLGFYRRDGLVLIKGNQQMVSVLIWWEW